VNLPSRLPASLPALFVRGTVDPTSQLRHAIRSKDFVPSLKIITLDGAGHWLMVQRKDEVTTLIADWIETTLDTGISLAKL
jgi:soluble epoxide hydrolase / lipid-phosphate phosphatase